VVGIFVLPTLEETCHFVKDNQPETFERTCFGLDGGITHTEAESKRQQAAIDKAKETPAAGPEEGGRPTRLQEALKLASENVQSANLYKKESCTSLPTGNSSARRIARLKRDHPDIAERLDHGEFKSVAAAERAVRGEGHLGKIGSIVVGA
jgi:hypothetical protein